MHQKSFSSSIHLGYNIKRLREILGVKQEELAVEFMVSDTNGSHVPPHSSPASGLSW
jgi:transcriptional regulator with XRE-family HTH domain